MYLFKGLYNLSENKKQHLKYGNLPNKEVETIPWDVIFVGLISLEIVKYNNKQAGIIAYIVY